MLAHFIHARTFLADRLAAFASFMRHNIIRDAVISLPVSNEWTKAAWIGRSDDRHMNHDHLFSVRKVWKYHRKTKKRINYQHYSCEKCAAVQTAWAQSKTLAVQTTNANIRQFRLCRWKTKKNKNGWHSLFR